MSTSKTTNNNNSDWNCPNCDIMIFGSKKECTKCNAQNPSQPCFNFNNADLNASRRNTKKGDWICKCNDMIFGTKKECKKCKMQNPNNFIFKNIPQCIDCGFSIGYYRQHMYEDNLIKCDKCLKKENNDV